MFLSKSCIKPRTFRKSFTRQLVQVLPKTHLRGSVCSHSIFLWKKTTGQAYGKNNQRPKLWHTFGEDGFHLKTIECVFRRKAFSLFSVIQKERVIFLVHPANCFSSAWHSSFYTKTPSPASHTLLKNNSLWFAVLFYFFSQKMYCCSVHVFLLSYFADDFLPIFRGLNLPLVTLFAPLWSPLRRLTLSLKKLGQGQTTAWLWTPTSLWSPSYGEIISKF